MLELWGRGVERDSVDFMGAEGFDGIEVSELHGTALSSLYSSLCSKTLTRPRLSVFKVVNGKHSVNTHFVRGGKSLERKETGQPSSDSSWLLRGN